MKVEIIKDGLLIVPETEFEIQYLRKYYHPKGLKAFLKHGVSVATVVGIKIELPIEELYPVELEDEEE